MTNKEIIEQVVGNLLTLKEEKGNVYLYNESPYDVWIEVEDKVDRIEFNIYGVETLELVLDHELTRKELDDFSDTIQCEWEKMFSI